MKKFGKSIFKGIKYAGLSLGAAALAGTNDVIPGFILDVLTKSGVPEVIAGVASGYGTPVLAAAILVALEQVRKHRDEIFNPPTP
jgi:hypothetical protein